VKYGKKKNIENVKKWEMHIVGLGVCWENWKTSKMRNTHCRLWNMARNTEKGENEKCSQ